MNLDKYNPLAKQKQAPIEANPSEPLSSWQDSAPVILLSEYLKRHKDQGMKLYRTDEGIPGLSFTPGLGLADQKTERWQIAMTAVELMQDAKLDLKILIANKLIDLPVYEVCCQR